MEKLKEMFLRAYADVPAELRKEIIVVVDDKTFTWNASYFEIKNKTELSKKILNSLKETKII